MVPCITPCHRQWLEDKIRTLSKQCPPPTLTTRGRHDHYEHRSATRWSHEFDTSMNSALERSWYFWGYLHWVTFHVKTMNSSLGGLTRSLCCWCLLWARLGLISSVANLEVPSCRKRERVSACWKLIIIILINSKNQDIEIVPANNTFFKVNTYFVSS